MHSNGYIFVNFISNHCQVHHNFIPIGLRKLKKIVNAKETPLW